MYAAKLARTPRKADGSRGSNGQCVKDSGIKLSPFTKGNNIKYIIYIIEK